MGKTKAILCFSGGKDSSYCLYKVLQAGEYDVCYLLTTMNGNNQRISMHGVREELLDAQAASIGIPQLKVYTYEASNAAYEKAMEETLLKAKSEGIGHVIFGDIFLEDLRTYRESNLAKINMHAVFPLWKQDTKALVADFLSVGFKTITCCINDAWLNETHVGKVIDEAFIKLLPDNVDACGENGEFHTFCFDGPIFKSPVRFTMGEKVYMPLNIPATNDCPVSDGAKKTKGFWYSELLYEK